MHKGTILGLLLLAIFTYISWPSTAKEPEMAKDREVTETKKPKINESIKVKRQAFQKKQVLRTAPIPKSQIPETKSRSYTLNEDEKQLHASLAYVDKNSYGYAKKLSPKDIAESAQLASVAEALQNPQGNASRLSAAVAPKEFDKDRYFSDPNYKKQYLTEVEPGRAFLTDPDSESQLKRLSPYLQTVEQGKSVQISVQALPGSPVSITSFDLGRLDNHLTYQTVEADASGTANFTFHGIEGTIEDSNILVASPMSSNKLKFIVNTQISSEILNEQGMN